jgi:hypothetical protein
MRTSHEIAQLDQERWEQQDAIAEADYISGLSDALDGLFPRWSIEPYLIGYVAGIKQLPCDTAGRIQPEDAAPLSLDDEF